jgi:hypothetical protein
MVILPDPPLVSRCKFIYSNRATFPVVVIVVNDNKSARNDTSGKIVEDTFGGMVLIRIHPKQSDWPWREFG